MPDPAEHESKLPAGPAAAPENTPATPQAAAAPAGGGEAETLARGRFLPRAPGRALHMKRWAVLVGVSEYRAPSLGLRFAHRDAKELWELLQTNACGAFVPERARVLLNEQATTAAIVRALRSFLKDAEPDDLVVLHFSGHGAEDPASKNKILYFLTYDTDPLDIAGTALPMREIMQSLDDYVKAKRIVMLMDTCHSAAVAGGKGAGPAEALTLERYQTEQQRSQEGFALFTSSEASELSRESAIWGGGHGLFTHLILEGLRGKADRNPRNGTVTLGELFDYVEEQARILGGESGQHPHPGSKSYDRDLLMAVTGGMTARAPFEVGKQIYRMAVETGDRGRFEAAAGHLAQADTVADLTGGLPEARMLSGLAWLGAGNAERACLDLQKAMDQGAREQKAGGRGCPEAQYHLGAALAKKGAWDEAARAFDAFAAANPTSARAPWARRAAELSRGHSSARRGGRRALLIGIGPYAGALAQLSGPGHDMALIGRVLRETMDFDDLVPLLHERATLEGMWREMALLHERTAPEDIVVVAFSGHATSNGEKVYLLPQDAMSDVPNGGRPTAESGRVSEPQTGPTGLAPDALDSPELRGISAEELHAWMNGLRARRKVLILDTHPKADFIALAGSAEATYSVLLAASPGQGAFEVHIEEEGESFVAGVLTYALTRRLAAAGPQATWAEILPGLVEAVHSRFAEQTPLFIGSENLPFLAGRWALHDLVGLLETSLFGLRRHFSPRDLGRLYETTAAQLEAPFPDLHLAFGTALLRGGERAAAAAALERAAAEDVVFVGDGAEGTAAQPNPTPDPDIAWGHALLQGLRGDQAAAIGHFRRFAAGANLAEPSAWEEEVAALLARVGARRPRAVVVGINAYSGPDVRPLSDAVADAEAIARALQDRFHCEVTLLTDVTTDALRGAFRDLATDARECPALFYFAGYGSRGDSGPSILGADARRDGVFDLPLSELASLVGAAPTNLACVFDADLQKPDDALLEKRAPRSRRAPAAGRYLPPDLRVRSSGTRDVVVRRVAWEPDSMVGRASIFRRPGTPMVQGLVDHLVTAPPGALSLRAWASSPPATAGHAGQWLAEGRPPPTAATAPFLLAQAPDEPLLADALGSVQITDLLVKARRSPWKETIVTLGRMIEEGQIPREKGYVDIGVAHALLGDLERATQAFKNALAATPDQPNPEASYHLGRVLLERDSELVRAQAELEAAAAVRPEDPAVQYYLGAAIRAVLEKQSMERVRVAWTAYQNAGAPLGHEEEIRAFLDGTTRTGRPGR